MKKALIFRTKNYTISAVESKGGRWRVAAISKKEDDTPVEYKNICGARAWAVICMYAGGVAAKDASAALKNKKEKDLLGVEWAALRLMCGAHPLIVPMKRSNLWLYVERTDKNEFQVRIVEPLGTRRTEPIIATGDEADKLLVQATSKPVARRKITKKT